jgi:hypothetical protein
MLVPYREFVSSNDFNSDGTLILTTIAVKACMDIGARPHVCGTIYIDWAQLSTFHLESETKSSLRNAVFFKYNRKMDNVQKHNNCKK